MIPSADNPVVLADPTIVTGNLSILEERPLLLLNSRQSKTPVGSDAWVRKTIEAARWAIGEGMPLIASVGMNTWELILWAIGEYKGKGIIVCPTSPTVRIEDEVSRLSDDFRLDAERLAWVFVEESGKSRSRKSWWETRDRVAFNLAGRIAPISVRDGGRLEESVQQWLMNGREMDPRFRVSYEGGSRSRLKIDVPATCRGFVNWDYLTHWARRCYGPWPGERSADYYRSIADSTHTYARSASATLKRILGEKLLRASGDHIRGKSPVVAFTSLSPSDAVPLMRWRKRYVRPTFEPYGIGIRIRTALDAGIRPVRYVKSGEDGGLWESVLLQGYGSGDWQAEREWRAIGDVDLSRLSSEDLVVLVPNEGRAEDFSRVTDLRIEVLSKEM